MKEPLSPAEARVLIRDILEHGTVSYDVNPTGHLMTELAADHLTILDCRNVLRGGTVEPAEFENDAWRYRVRTNRMYVVIEFESDAALFLVTAWRLKK